MQWIGNHETLYLSKMEVFSFELELASCNNFSKVKRKKETQNTSKLGLDIQIGYRRWKTFGENRVCQDLFPLKIPIVRFDTDEEHWQVVYNPKTGRE